VIKIGKKYVIIKQSNLSKLQGQHITENTKNDVLKVTSKAPSTLHWNWIEIEP
jgi:hypothetical protein